jgi:hypothetical protein
MPIRFIRIINDNKRLDYEKFRKTHLFSSRSLYLYLYSCKQNNDVKEKGYHTKGKVTILVDETFNLLLMIR